MPVPVPDLRLFFVVDFVDCRRRRRFPQFAIFNQFDVLGQFRFAQVGNGGSATTSAAMRDNRKRSPSASSSSELLLNHPNTEEPNAERKLHFSVTNLAYPMQAYSIL